MALLVKTDRAGMNSLAQLITLMTLTWGIASSAIAAPTTYSGTSKLILDDFIATVMINVVEGDEMSIDIAPGTDESYILSTTLIDGAVHITGPEQPLNYEASYIGWRTSSEARLAKYLLQYPSITINLPEKLPLEVTDFIAKLTIGNTQGNLLIANSVYVIGNVGDIAQGQIELSGSGDLHIGHVAGALETILKGSGDLSFKSAGQSLLKLKGSGDIEIGKIAGPAEIVLNGSGDITTNDISGNLDAELNGSGNIEIAKVDGNASIALRGSGDVVTNSITGNLSTLIFGSGDIDVLSMNGNFQSIVRGSGDVDVQNGTATSLTAEITGSGSISFMGVATNPKLQTNASGDITIGKMKGVPEISGRGEIEIDGKDYSLKRGDPGYH